MTNSYPTYKLKRSDDFGVFLIKTFIGAYLLGLAIAGSAAGLGV